MNGMARSTEREANKNARPVAAYRIPTFIPIEHKGDGDRDGESERERDRGAGKIQIVAALRLRSGAHQVDFHRNDLRWSTLASQ